MSSVVTILDSIKVDWKERQLELQKIGLTKKEANNLHVENRKLNILEKLKQQGGPFTSSEQIDIYIKSKSDDNKKKVRRMRDEVTYARDTSKSLPKSSPLFKIFNTTAGRRRLMTAEEFGANLMILLGKKDQRTNITLEDFRKALN